LIFLSLKFVLWVSGYFERDERLLLAMTSSAFLISFLGQVIGLGWPRLCVSCACVLVLWFLLTAGWVMPDFQS
jgi:hypothetical protein